MLYDKDHYKLALGQLNTAKNLIDKLSQGECQSIIEIVRGREEGVGGGVEGEGEAPQKW